jgi:uncharacterized protein YraI
MAMIAMGVMPRTPAMRLNVPGTPRMTMVPQAMGTVVAMAMAAAMETAMAETDLPVRAGPPHSFIV